MPSVNINLVALAAAVVFNMLLGYIWYSKPVFGKMWQKLVGLSDKDMDGADKVTPMVAMLILAIVEIFVLNHFVAYSAYFYPGYSDVSVGLLTGLWIWVGFVFPVMASNYMFAQRRKKLVLIDSGYQLVVLLVAGVILSVWK